MSKWMLALFAGVFALLTLGASIVIPFLVFNEASEKIANLEIPLLAVSGFLGVFACVVLLVLAFKAMELTTPEQALGMPEGSIRALIAIFLITTLGMSALFLLGPQRHAPGTPGKQEAGQADKGASNKAENKTNKEVSQQSVPGFGGTSSIQLAVANTNPAVPGAGTSPATGGSNSSTSGTEPSKSSGEENQASTQGSTNEASTRSAAGDDDLAKQFFTLLGGLVTTVIGFYFGSQTANSANAKAVKVMTEALRR